MASISRRSFLKTLSVGIATLAVAPKIYLEARPRIAIKQVIHEAHRRALQKWMADKIDQDIFDAISKSPIRDLHSMNDL